MPTETKRSQNERLRVQLENERTSFMTHWRDLGEFILPRRPRLTVSDVNKGDRRNQKIIDSTATLAARTLRAGMMGGVTSPARPWFRLTTPDPDMAEFGSVKEWLHLVSQRLSAIFLKSNLYNALPIIYGDIGTFGTSAMAVEEDFTGDVMRAYPFPIGSYMIANNDKLKVDVFFREFRYTVRQLVMKFGEKDAKTGRPMWERFSSQVKAAWDNGDYETWVDVCHVIQPNQDFDPNKLSAKHKRFSSCYYEKGVMGATQGSYLDSGYDVYLRESGFDRFPILCPRWEVTGEDVYGTDCPGMTALGDVKALQLMHKRKAQAIEKGINPPMTGPNSLKTTKASILPGDITYVDVREGQQGFRAAHEVNMRIADLVADVQEHQQRVRRAFYEDLFLMLATSDRREITAREIEERHEEKLLAVGPVLEQLNQDVLDPLIDLVFEYANRQGLIPPAPEELRGMDLKVEYISVMAQAQKLVGIGSMERLASFTGNLAAQSGDPTVLDKLNVDNLIDRYADRLGTDPDVVRTDEEVAVIREGRAKAQQAAQTTALLKDGSTAAKNLAGADMSGDNALTRLADQAKVGQLVQQ